MRERRGSARAKTAFIGTLALAGVTLAAVAHAAIRPDRAASNDARSNCPSSVVRYGAGGAAGLANVPWVNFGAKGHVYLFFYSSALADSRVNQSTGAVVYTGGGTASAATKVLWAPPHPGRSALLTGTQLDGDGMFTQRLSASGRAFPSIVDVPAAGCWRLTLRTGTTRAAIVLDAVDPPAAPVCDPTPLRIGSPSPIGSTLPWLVATPTGAGITGTIFYRLPAGANTAAIYPNKQAPDNGTTKILWKVPTRMAGDAMLVRAVRLDGGGVAAPQTFPLSHDGYPGASFPSDIDVSSTGCWLITIRSGKAAGIVVFNAVPTG